MSEIDWDTPESAKIYDRNCDHQFQKGQTLIKMMKIKNGESVLDIGCGTGWQAVNVLGIVGPFGKLTCIDPSSYRIELARRKFGVDFPNNVRFLVGQAEDLSAIPDNSINHAYFCSSFHWVDDKRAALRETYRVLKPGGSVGMTTLDRDSPDTKIKLVDSILAKYNINRSYELYRGINRINAFELHNLLSEAGFTFISIESRTIPRQYRSPEEFLKHLQERDGSRNLLKNIPDEIKEKIKQDIYEELTKVKNPAFAELGIVTLFAIATKSNE